MNNVFCHLEGPYPLRNFTSRALLMSEVVARRDWEEKYGEKVRWLETLVEPPRTGEMYKRCGYREVGMTKGYTCKRPGGTGSDGWGGSTRVWDTENLRPKRVFVKYLL